MMDIIERLEELMNLELFDADEQINLTPDVAARIVAAEIIANAIKEAAPAKREPLTIEIKRMANDAAYYDHIISALRESSQR